MELSGSNFSLIRLNYVDQWHIMRVRPIIDRQTMILQLILKGSFLSTNNWMTWWYADLAMTKWNIILTQLKLSRTLCPLDGNHADLTLISRRIFGLPPFIKYEWTLCLKSDRLKFGQMAYLSTIQSNIRKKTILRKNFSPFHSYKSLYKSRPKSKYKSWIHPMTKYKKERKYMKQINHRQRPQ